MHRSAMSAPLLAKTQQQHSTVSNPIHTSSMLSSLPVLKCASLYMLPKGMIPSVTFSPPVLPQSVNTVGWINPHLSHLLLVEGQLLPEAPEASFPIPSYEGMSTVTAAGIYALPCALLMPGDKGLLQACLWTASVTPSPGHSRSAAGPIVPMPRGACWY